MNEVKTVDTAKLQTIISDALHAARLYPNMDPVLASKLIEDAVTKANLTIDESMYELDVTVGEHGIDVRIITEDTPSVLMRKPVSGITAEQTFATAHKSHDIVAIIGKRTQKLYGEIEQLMLDNPCPRNTNKLSHMEKLNARIDELCKPYNRQGMSAMGYVGTNSTLIEITATMEVFTPDCGIFRAQFSQVG